MSLLILCPRNITKLSRAAVHGDKNALDMFSQKQNGGYGNSFVSHEAHEAFSFFVGGASGMSICL